MAGDIYLVRDVLDNQLVDRDKRRMGKVDGLVMTLRKDKPPRVTCIEVGASTLGYRLHHRVGRWVEEIGRRWGIRRGKAFRIAWSKVQDIGIDVRVDLKAEETPALDWEKWLREKIVERIPGSS